MTSFNHTRRDCHLTSRGSLPLKKRKLYHYAGTPHAQQPPMVEISTTPRVLPAQNEALALLAAASGILARLPPTTSTLAEDANTQDRSTSTPPPFTVLRSWTGSSGAIHESSGIGPSPVTPIGTEAHDTSHPSTAGSQRPSRIHHPPLSAPLSNGCHGRTSRNNSFCRRTPCYKGSTYCKLHYQQYIVAGTRLPLESTADSEPNSITSTPTAHQDKRFTGCDDEVRCVATTTRGRPCAYVCVAGTKYCRLHAAYDTHPPPRRGGSSSSATTPKPEPKLDIMPRMQGCPTLPDLGTGRRFSTPSLQPALVPYNSGNSRRSPSSVSSDDSFAASSHSFDSSPDASSQVLLSSISSDQWLDRKVKFATGPFVNRTGIVEKWGNGWVTVRVHGGLTHNRRSIELYLVPPSSTTSENEADSKYIAIPPAVSSETEEKVADNARPEIVPARQFRLFQDGQPRSHSISVDRNYSDNGGRDMHS